MVPEQYDFQSLKDVTSMRLCLRGLTLILLTSTKWWAPASDSKWRMGFNSAFKGLSNIEVTDSNVPVSGPLLTIDFVIHSYI
jgi:hypothetical protein